MKEAPSIAHLHAVGNAHRAHIQASQLRSGQRVYAVPRDETTPRGGPVGGKPLGPIPIAGAELVITEYLLGCAQRGAITCYELVEVAN